MRIPKIQNYHDGAPKETIEIPQTEFSKPAYIFYTEKTRMKYIKNVEKIVRSSMEYRNLIAYLKGSLGMDFCMFFNNVSMEKGRRVGIEIHHIPFSLFDIVNIIVKKREAEKASLDPLDVSEEVVRLHYEGKVGLVPLSTTVHQLYHRGDIFIPLQYVDKGFLAFYHEYKEYTRDYTEMLVKLIKMSKDFDLAENSVLKRKLIYLDNDGYDSTPEYINQEGE